MLTIGNYTWCLGGHITTSNTLPCMGVKLVGPYVLYPVREYSPKKYPSKTKKIEDYCELYPIWELIGNA